MSCQTTARAILTNIEDIQTRIELLNALCPTASLTRKVKAFHKLYEAPDATGTGVDDTASHMSDDRLKLRLGLVTEEVEELQEAVANRDVIEMADALADILYVCAGFAIELGINLDAAVTEVHASNMTKLAADGSVIRREDGKILKGENYQKPDIRRAINL